MKLKLYAMMIILVTATILTAGNSVFSFKGAPCQNFGYDVYGISMGGVGISDVFRTNTGYANPAILGETTKTLFSTGLLFGWTGYKSNDNASKSYKDNSLDFPYFSVAIPVNNNHFGFQFNSLMSGVLKNQIRITQDSLNIVERQSVDHYIYRADLMYATHYESFNIGLGLNYFFGHETRKFNQDAGFGIFNTSEVLEKSFKNPSFTVGFTGEFKNMATGFYYSHECSLKGDQIRTSIHETEDLGSVEYPIPSQIGTGITLNMMNEYKISSDLIVSLWKNANNSNYDRNSWKLGIGFAHEPGASNRKTFLGKLPKRIGISYRELPFLSDNKSISEISIASGLTFPLKDNESQLDLGIQYLIRGSLDKNNLQDNSLMFIIGATGYDILSKAFNRKAPRKIPVIEDISE